MTADLRALRDAPYELLAAMEARVRAARPDVSQRRADFWLGLGFRLRDRWCVAPREDVREIITPPSLTRAPGAKPWLMGVANVRGGILPVADLALFLGLPRRNDLQGSRVLVYNSTRVPVGFLVDEVAGYRQFVAGDQQHEQLASSGAFAPYLLGAFERAHQPWLAFSFSKVVSSPEFAHAGW